MQTNGLYGTMLQDYYASIMAETMERRRAELAKIKTPAQARAYVKSVRAKYREALGEFPKKTPLKPVVTRTQVIDGIAVDNVIFESRPGYKVTANFLRPAKFSGKLPGVLGVMGHAEEGNLSTAYQSFAFGLAKKKFAVLLVEPAGQGERKQFWNTPGIDQTKLGCCSEHNLCNKMLLLQGDAFCKWRIWDGVRALDYLLTRPEVDTTRVGVTGNSGGGTMSTYLWSFDDRFTMGAPSCYLTSFERNYDNELPVDAEQVIPGLAAKGFEMADFLIGRAPNPAIILAKSNDFFDVRGAAANYEEVKRIYRLLGAEDNIRFYVGDGNHGYTQNNREAMYGFFTEHAQGKRSAKEPELKLPTKKQISVTPNRRVIDLPGAVSLPQIIARDVTALQKKSGRGKAAAIRKYLAEVQQIAVPEERPDYQVPRPFHLEDGRIISRFGIRTEPGIRAFLHILGAKDECFCQVPAFDTMTLYVAHEGAAEELLDGRAVGKGVIAALDVRGVGESRPSTTDQIKYDIRSSYAAEYFYDAAGLFLTRPLPGGRANDVLAAAALLKQCGVKKLVLVGRGIGAIAAVMAAAAAPKLFAEVKLYNMPVSYAALCKRGITTWPQSSMPIGFLKIGDLGDLVKAANAVIAEPWGDLLSPMTAAQKKKDLAEN